VSELLNDSDSDQYEDAETSPVTRLHGGRSRFDPRQGQGREFFSSPPRPDRLWITPSLLSNE